MDICKSIKEAIIDEQKGASDYDKLKEELINEDEFMPSIIVSDISKDERKHKETLEKIKTALRC